MRKSGIAQGVLLLCAGCLLAVAWLPARAQDNNLLQNPGFEAPYNDAGGDPPRQVADGWTPWHIPAAAGSPSFANLQPEYEPTAPDTTRIRSGSNAQLIKSFFATHDGGVYQTVTGITPGATLEFSMYAYVWSNTFDEVDVSEEDGDVTVQVGIDPTGGTDGESSSVVWSAAGIEKYDAYNEYSVEAEAGGDAVTVFIRTTIGVPVKNNNIYLDDASLTAAGGEQPQPEQPTATDTATDTAANTVAAPTEETIASATSTATASSTPTATATVEEATVTETEDPIFLTATAIIEAATATASANQTATAVAGEQQPTATATLVPTLTPPSISNEFPATITHTVARGETVAILADRYGSSIDAIAGANGLDSNYLIQVGQVLIIPVKQPLPASETPGVVVVTATPSGPVPVLGSNDTYTVLPGDTLTRIARLFNTSVAALAQLNGIVNLDQLQVGQVLQLPDATSNPANPPSQPPSSSQSVYVVRPGDTLYRVALLYGITIGQLAQANNITNLNLIYVGQVLIIP